MSQTIEAPKMTIAEVLSDPEAVTLFAGVFARELVAEWFRVKDERAAIEADLLAKNRSVLRAQFSAAQRSIRKPNGKGTQS